MIDPSPTEMIVWYILISFLGGLAIYELLSHFRIISSRIRHSYFQRFIFLWFGMSIALVQEGFVFKDLSSVEEFIPKEYNPPAIRETWRLLPDGSLIFKSNKTFIAPDADIRSIYPEMGINSIEKKLVIFITTTDYTVVQNAVLTRLAQALYPARHFVLWVVVSLPLGTSLGANDKTENSKITFKKSLLEHPWLEEYHQQNLHNLLRRFGIPYILLSSKEEKKTDVGAWIKARDRIRKGYQTGLFWAMEHFSEGVIFMGDEHYTYNSALFKEIQKTKAISCWKLGLVGDIKTELIFGRFKSGEVKAIGYYDKRKEVLGSVSFERGGFAFDMKYIRAAVPSQENLKRLTHYSLRLPTNDLEITLEDIQVILKSDDRGGDSEDSSFYVWKTITRRQSWPSGIQVKSKIFDLIHEKNGTAMNMNALLKNVFGVRFPMMENLIFKQEVEVPVKDYDLRKLSIYFN